METRLRQVTIYFLTTNYFYLGSFVYERDNGVIILVNYGNISGTH
jgi:hypothetical protein